MQANESQFYETALSEVASRSMVPAVAAMALVEADGDEKKAVARYIKLRVAELRDLNEREMQATELALERADKQRQVLLATARLGKVHFERTGQLDEEALEAMLASLDADPTLALAVDRVRGNSLLHHCAQRGLERPVRMLLASGADAHARNGDGKSPAAVAASEHVRRLLA